MKRIHRISPAARAQAAGAALLLALGAAGTALAADDAAPAAPAAAADAGDTVRNCVNLNAIKTTRVLDDQTILFEMNGKQTLVNRLPRRCPGLGFDKAFGYKTSISQLCSQDIIWVVTNSGRDMGAHCGLGKFEVYVPPVDASKPGGHIKMEPATQE